MARPSWLWSLPAWLLAAFLLGGVLAGRSWAFRDAGHFYYPTWRWLAEEQDEGRWAWWNPWVDLGAPTLGEASLGRLYPPLWLLRAPLPRVGTIKLVLLAHFLVAFWGVRRTARRARLSPPASMLAATAYTFSGGLLFLVYNPPYLFAASWAPWALDACDGVLRRPGPRTAAILSIILSALVLAGDAQAALHVLILGGLWWFACRRSWRRRAMARCGRKAAWLFAAVALAVAITAAQWLPARAALHDSDRVLFSRPRSIWEVLELATQSNRPPAWKALVGEPATDGHDGAVYQFSVPPWQWLELLFPGANGRWGARNTRWTSAIPAEGRVWTPSYYFGAATCVMGLLAMRLRSGGSPRSRLRRRWTWAVLLSIWAACGVYGVGFWLNEALLAWGRDTQVGPQVGSFTWLLNLLLPSYAWFRYPAKWAPFALWGFAMLAGSQLDRWSVSQPARRTSGAAFAWSAAVAALLAGAAWMFGPQWMEAASQVDAVDFETFGPLDPAASAARLWRGLAHGASVLALAACIVRGLPTARLRVLGLVLLAVVDLAVAHRDLLTTCPDRTLADTPRSDEAFGQSLAPAGDLFGLHQSNAFARPPGAIPGDQAWVRAERAAGVGRGHLPAIPRIRMLQSVHSLESASLRAWRTALRRWSAEERERLFAQSERLAEPIWFGEFDWLATESSRLREHHVRRAAVIQRRMLAADCPTAWIEDRTNLETPRPESRGGGDPTVVRTWTLQSDRVTVQVAASRRGVLAIPMLYATGWSVQSVDAAGVARPSRLVKCNGLLCGVLLSPGKQTVTFRYAPPYLGPGVALSLLGIAVCVALWVRREQNNRRARAGVLYVFSSQQSEPR